MYYCWSYWHQTIQQKEDKLHGKLEGSNPIQVSFEIKVFTVVLCQGPGGFILELITFQSEHQGICLASFRYTFCN